MAVASERDFCPTWASAPGDTISDVLAERNLPIATFAEQIGQTIAETDDLLRGRAAITIAMARRLARVLGASVEFWMSRDFQYRETVAQAHNEDYVWLSSLPIGDMVKFGWIKPTRPSDELAECLNFFNVDSVSAWHQKYAHVEQIAAFRISKSFESRPASVAAWLRFGEVEASEIECRPWSRTNFEATLLKIRALTREKDPGRFLPVLRNLCADSGVAIVIARFPSGCRASGAARFLSPAKALLQLSVRHLSDDQFWFTFFHEAGHLVLHQDHELFVDGIGEVVTEAENEANEFAARTLLSPESQSRMLQLPLDAKSIVRFAQHAGLSPGIVVGQLQYRGRIGHNRFNSLKRRYTWSADPNA